MFAFSLALFSSGRALTLLVSRRAGGVGSFALVTFFRASALFVRRAGLLRCLFFPFVAAFSWRFLCLLRERSSRHRQ